MGETISDYPRRRLKIILMNSFLNAGGAQQATLRLGRQLQLRGHQVEVWFLYKRGEFFDTDGAGVRIRVLADRDSLGAPAAARMLSKLHGLLRQERPDAVVAFLPLAATLGAAAALAAGVKVRIASQRVPGSAFGRVMQALDRAWGTLGVYTGIACVSGAVRDSFSEYPKAYRRRLSVVHNGIEWEPSDLAKSGARAALALPQDEVVFASAGRLEPEKNLDFLLEPLAATAGVHLAIAGEGAERPALERRVAELGLQGRVTFLGKLGKQQMRRLMGAADVFVQPSLYEGQSNALLEAMHAGLPVLVSDIPTQRETVVPDAGPAAGLLASLDDPEAWRSAFARLRDDAELRAELGRRAATQVQRRFGLGQMVDGFEAQLAQLWREGDPTPAFSDQPA
jgi:glycosyltransferase involved in cell wall biosynthesis